MKLLIYSIRDEKGKLYNNPFFKHNERDARFDFRRLVNDKKSLPGQYPDDFDLYELGIYDDQTGTFESHKTPRHIEKAVNVVERSETQNPVSAVQ